MPELQSVTEKKQKAEKKGERQAPLYNDAAHVFFCFLCKHNQNLKKEEGKTIVQKKMLDLNISWNINLLKANHNIFNGDDSTQPYNKTWVLLCCRHAGPPFPRTNTGSPKEVYHTLYTWKASCETQPAIVN